jgi:hypothetical protein
MKRSAALLAAASLAASLAATSAAAVDYGPDAAEAAQDGKCLEVDKVVDATTGKQVGPTENPREVDCPDGVSAGSVVFVTNNVAPPAQQRPTDNDPLHEGTLTRQTTAVTPQPPFRNPYSTTVVKPTPKTASTTTPAHH